MIRRARREDIPLLMELWQASFGDCMEYISFFFKNRFSPEKTFLYEESGRPVAMPFFAGCGGSMQGRAIYRPISLCRLHGAGAAWAWADAQPD